MGCVHFQKTQVTYTQHCAWTPPVHTQWSRAAAHIRPPVQTGSTHTDRLLTDRAEQKQLSHITRSSFSVQCLHFPMLWISGQSETWQTRWSTKFALGKNNVCLRTSLYRTGSRVTFLVGLNFLQTETDKANKPQVWIHLCSRVSSFFSQVS